MNKIIGHIAFKLFTTKNLQKAFYRILHSSICVHRDDLCTQLIKVF